jgi:predicted PurR-regulated permease PerM
VNFVIQTIIQPRVVGVTVGLSATLSFLSLIIWATILGASGAFLAIPLSLFVKYLFVDVDPEHDWVGPLLSSGNGGERAGKLARRDEPAAVEPVEGSA